MYYFEKVKVLPLQGQGSRRAGEMIGVRIFVQFYSITASPVLEIAVHGSIVDFTVSPLAFTVMV